MRSELGFVENLTVLFCFIASYLALKCFFIAGKLPQSWLLRPFFFLFAIGAFFLGGEEASWGQHYFGWEATGFMLENNRQQETNLHNLGRMTEQLPKIILHLAALVSILWVLYVKKANVQLNRDKVWYWLMPAWPVLWPAVIGFAVRLWERVYAWLKIPDWDPSETYIGAFKELKEGNETFLILFCVAYLASILYRYGQHKS